MAETIPGGAYLRDDKQTWQDANGNPIAAPAVTEAAGPLTEVPPGTEPTVEEVMAAVEAGTLTPEEALCAARSACNTAAMVLRP